MPDSELAQWQSTLKAGEPKHILAEREWQRRMLSHQLEKQYDLDARLAKGAESHAERIVQSSQLHAAELNRSNRIWSVWVAVIGIVATLLGAWYGAKWQSKQDNQTATASFQPAVRQSELLPASQSQVPQGSASQALRASQPQASK